MTGIDIGFDGRAARITWTVILVLLLCWAAYLIREPIFVLIVAILFAYLLRPIVSLLELLLSHRLPGSSRLLALTITYVLILGFLVTFGVRIGSRVADEATSLAARAPLFIQHLQDPNFKPPLPDYLQFVNSELIARLKDLLQQHSGQVVSYLSTAGFQALSYSSYLLFLVLVPIIAFFLLKDGPEIREHFLSLLPEGLTRETWRNILADTNILLGQYVRAVGVLCVITFVVFALAFTIMGVPYGILLASIAFPLEFIPLFGPLTAAIIIIVVTLATGYSNLFAVVLFLAIYRLVQDYVISPRLMSAGVEVHPLLVIIGVLAGEQLGGVAGMFLSVPVIALLRVFYRRLAA